MVSYKLALLGLPLMLSCGALVMPVATKADGQLTMGTTTFVPTQCSSGDRMGFYGVDLTEPSHDGLLRLAFDPIDGARIRLKLGGQDLKFDATSCPSLVATAEPTGWQVNDIRDLRGSIAMSCRLPDGQTLEGNIHFDHFH